MLHQGQACGRAARSVTLPHAPSAEGAGIADGPDISIAAFQAFIRERYYATDAARGPARTFLWFSEEVGELAAALGRRERGDDDIANLEEEFADVLAWLATLANISGVELARAVQRKYLEDGGPEGTK